MVKAKKEPDASLSVVILGGQSSGKTQLFNRLQTKPFSEEEPSARVLMAEGQDPINNLRLIDTSTDPMFSSLSSIPIKCAETYVICIDLSNHLSIIAAEEYIEKIKQQDDPDIIDRIVIVTTKNDLPESSQEISKREVELLSFTHGITQKIIPTSAKNGMGLEDLRQILIQQKECLISRPKFQKIKPTLDIVCNFIMASFDELDANTGKKQRDTNPYMALKNLNNTIFELSQITEEAKINEIISKCRKACVTFLGQASPDLIKIQPPEVRPLWFRIVQCIWHFNRSFMSDNGNDVSERMRVKQHEEIKNQLISLKQGDITDAVNDNPENLFP